jgi:hypothetical protein
MSSVVIINTLTFMFKDYKHRVNQPYSSEGLQGFLSVLNILLFIAYLIECLIKIPAMGFAFEPYTYLRSFTNVFDFILLIYGFIYFSLADKMESVSWISFFRTIRIFQTLTAIKKLKKLKVILKALFVSFQNMFNVISFLMIFLLVYSGIATFMLRGKLEDRYYSLTRCRILQRPLPSDNTWAIVPENRNLCGYKECPANTYCGSEYDVGLQFE